MNPLNWKRIFISGAVFAVLAAVLAIGVYLVLKPQSQSVTSKAATSCVQKWPADPASGCGKSTQSPAQGATGVSLTPNFHWDYGYDATCTRSSGCSSYYANVYLWKGNCPTGQGACGDGNLVATCGLATRSSGPYTDAPFSCFGLTSLQPNTAYTWRSAPGGDNLVHAEQNWNYTFTTGTGTQTVACNETCNSTNLCDTTIGLNCIGGKCVNSTCPTTQDSKCLCPMPQASCLRVTANKELNSIKLGDTVTFTGYGTLTNGTTGDSIDKINFIILKDGVSVSNTEVNTVIDSAGTGVWKAMKDFVASSSGTYSVRTRVHWLSRNIWLE